MFPIPIQIPIPINWNWFRPADDYENGEIVSLSKEFVREHYLGTGHYEDLYDAREKGTEEPPIPALPDEIINQTAELYASMFERLTGQHF